MQNNKNLPEQYPPTGITKLIPSRCAVCGKWPSRGICENCYQHYKKTTPRCQHCAIELPPENTRQTCGHCLNTPYTFNNTIAAVSYEEPWANMLRQFKFHQHTEKAIAMARLLYLKILQNSTTTPDLIIPIPNAKNRLQERGYNQAWEITKHLSHLLKIKAQPDILIRATEEASQTKRKRQERFKALKNAFQLNEKYRHTLKDKHIALVDDVMTTGATLESASKTLKQAATSQISIWVFARTPQERHQR